MLVVLCIVGPLHDNNSKMSHSLAWWNALLAFGEVKTIPRCWMPNTQNSENLELINERKLAGCSDIRVLSRCSQTIVRVLVIIIMQLVWSLQTNHFRPWPTRFHCCTHVCPNERSQRQWKELQVGTIQVCKLLNYVHFPRAIRVAGWLEPVPVRLAAG